MRHNESIHINHWRLCVHVRIEERRQYLLAEEAQKRERQRMLERTLSATDGVQRLAIDLNFDAIMNDKELRSLAKQMKLSYGSVKQMATPFQLHFLNCSEPLQQSLARFSADKWRVHWHHDAHVTDIVAPSVSVLLWLTKCICVCAKALYVYIYTCVCVM
jgi:hypothetical protein